jgi:cell division septation protein DedD
MKKLAVFSSLVCTFALADIASAQSDNARIPGDSVLARARKLVDSGREADGRKLVDSVLHASTPKDAIYAEALYTRAAMAPNAAEAERDYRRLLIEAPLAPRAEDALLQLANLLQARGDRRGAGEYLQRFMLTYANSPARPRVAVSLVRLLFEQGTHQEARACEAFRQARQAVPRENFELRNQLDFYAPRCAMYADAAPSTVPSSAPVTAPVTAHVTPPVTAPVTAAVATPDTAHVTAPVTAHVTPPVTAPAGGAAAATGSFYSVQIAAYDTDDAAQRVVKILVEQGIEARVDGETRPFRVRIGRYATRADAVRAQQALKAQGHPGFVTVVNR